MGYLRLFLPHRGTKSLRFPDHDFSGRANLRCACRANAALFPAGRCHRDRVRRVLAVRHEVCEGWLTTAAAVPEPIADRPPSGRVSDAGRRPKAVMLEAVRRPRGVKRARSVRASRPAPRATPRRLTALAALYGRKSGRSGAGELCWQA